MSKTKTLSVLLDSWLILATCAAAEPLAEKVAADLGIVRNWRPGTLEDDGKRSGTEKGFRKQRPMSPI